MDDSLSFRAIWDRHSSALALDQLSGEIHSLRMALRGEAISVEHDIAAAHLALAEGAALAMDGPKMLEHLRNAGEWPLRIAEQRGASPVVDAIKVSMAL